jgi:SRSO17 transposase
MQERTTPSNRLERYLDMIGDVLGNEKRRASFATYALGLLSNEERKSVESIAVRGCESVKEADAAHQRVLHFLTDAPWSDREVRLAGVRYALSAITAREPVQVAIIDDTGFLKKGVHSVGVQRQYTGTAGKVTNCQVAVSLTLASDTLALPVDFDLYLPESWMKDQERRQEARISAEQRFRTKIQIALTMLGRAQRDGLPLGVVLADSGYGNASNFREGLRDLELDYAVEVVGTTVVGMVDGDRIVEKLSAQALAERVSATHFRRITWREGTRHSLSARFAFFTVAVDQLEHQLIIEWRDGESRPNRFHVTTLDASLPKEHIVHFLKQRWKIERTYQDLKGELGLDHYEGRRYTGWYHHVSVALVCYAFLAAERARIFPPQETGTNYPQAFAATV